MQITSTVPSSPSDPAGHQEAGTAYAEGAPIELDEDLFPWDGGDELLESGDATSEVSDERPWVCDKAARPARQRIERYKEELWLRRRLEDLH